MSRYKLAPSLDRLFNEIDAKWPKRDRRTDGWYNPNSTGIGHRLGHNGLVHAIDVDADGISPSWIIRNMYHSKSVLWYVISNRTIWSNTYNFDSFYYGGSNPHTDHMHIEIYHSTTAEKYSGDWGIAPGKSGFGSAPQPESDFGSRDYKSYLVDSANQFNKAAGTMKSVAKNLKTWRR